MGELEITRENEKDLVLKALELCGSKSALSQTLGYKFGNTSHINRILNGEGNLSQLKRERLLIVIHREENRKQLRKEVSLDFQS